MELLQKRLLLVQKKNKNGKVFHNGKCIMSDILPIYFHVKAKLENAPELQGTYHNWMHVKTHYDTVCHLGWMEDIEECAFGRLKKASLYHDTGYLTGNADKHEYESTIIARKELPPFGVHKLDIDEICSLIMTTVPGYIPIDIVEDIMVDADYGYLGMDYYLYVSELLRRERGVLHSVWRRQQIAFLENHTFHTASARKLFDRQKEINLKRLLRDAKDI